MRNIILIILLMFPIVGLASPSSLDNPVLNILDIEQESCAVSEMEADISTVEIAARPVRYGNSFEVNDYAKGALAFRIEDPGRPTF